MSRVIKFRAWEGFTGKMFQNHEPLLWNRIMPAISVQDGSEYQSYRVMQFTGLTDCNGVEIYEGDIVKWDDASKGEYWRVAQVEWHEKGTWNYKTIPHLCINCLKSEPHNFKLGNFIYTPSPSQYGNVLEVIGNIYEHPHLLDRPSESGGVQQ